MIKDLTQLPSVVLGQIVDVDSQGTPRVSWQDGTATTAQVVWMANPPVWQEFVGVGVVLGFIDGDEQRPIILGLLSGPPAPARKPETLRIESGRELVIECGEAKIALRADGRIEIRGTHIISRSSGPNKIKGGSVFIN